jgi:TatD DNase family protein
MIFVDTHAHLNFVEFDSDYEQVISRAREAGVEKIIISGTDPINTLKAVDITSQFDGLYATLGTHPTHIKGGFSLEADNGLPPCLLLESHDGSYCQQFFLKDFELMAQADDIVAIGEVGLDYKKGRATASREVQTASLGAIIRSTIDIGKPYIFHVRPSQGSQDAFKDLAAILSYYFSSRSSNLNGVIHCYTGDYKWFKVFDQLGFLVSYTGLITFSDDFNSAIKEIPLESILLETDCPYLSPKSSNRKRSEPIDVIAVAKKIAQVKGVELDRVARLTTKRAEELFRI